MTTKGYKEKIQMLQQTIDKLEDNIKMLNNELLLCKEVKKEYIQLFKKHLALNISSLMQGYSNQEYELTNVKYDEKNKVSMINMEIFTDTGNLLVTWRVKKSKDRYFVIDLIVADISLVVTKRSEFNSMLKKVDGKLSELNNILRSQNESSYSIIIN